MSHLEEKLAEFVFDELPDPDMEVARRHVAHCLECQARVASFRKIRHAIERLPEVDLPRRIVFVPSGSAAPRRSWLPLVWAIPVAATLLLALLLPVQIDWTGSGVAVALGRLPAPTVVPSETGETEARTALPQIQPVDYAALDYDRIAASLREGQLDWIEAELDRRMASLNDVNRREIQRVRADFNYWLELQRVYWEDTIENASSIQLLAQRIEQRQ